MIWVVIILIVIVVVSIVKRKTKSATFVDVPTQKKNRGTLRDENVDYSQIAESLTDSQKYASMSLLFFFYGFCHEKQYMHNALNILDKMAEIMQISKEEALIYCSTYLDDDEKLMTCVKKIDNFTWMKYLLKECYKLVKFAPTAKPIFMGMIQELNIPFYTISN